VRKDLSRRSNNGKKIKKGRLIITNVFVVIAVRKSVRMMLFALRKDCWCDYSVDLIAVKKYIVFLVAIFKTTVLDCI